MKIKLINLTSLEIGEIIGKEHKTILRDIRNEIKQLGTEKGENNFVLIYYKDKSNRSQPMYNTSKFIKKLCFGRTKIVLLLFCS